MKPEGPWEPIENTGIEIQYMRGRSTGGHRFRASGRDLYVLVPPEEGVSTSKRSRAISEAAEKATGLLLDPLNRLIWMVGYLRLHHELDPTLHVDLEITT